MSTGQVMPLSPPTPGTSIDNSVVEEKWEDSITRTDQATESLEKIVESLTSFLNTLENLDMGSVDQSALTLPNPQLDETSEYNKENDPTILAEPDPIDQTQFEDSIDFKPEEIKTIAIDPVLNDETKKLTRLTEWAKPTYWNPESFIEAMPVTDVSVSDFETINTDSLPLYSREEKAYISTLLVVIQTKLKSIITNGGSGLSSVEQDMFDRESERDALANQEAMDAVADTWSQRGFLLPSIGFFDKLTQIQTEYQNKKLDKSRSIAEESRKIAIDSEKHALTTGAQIEGTTQDYWGKLNDRALQEAAEVVKSGIALLDFRLKKVLGRLDFFGKQIDAFAAWAGAVKAVMDGDIAIEQIGFATKDANIRIDTLNAELFVNKNNEIKNTAKLTENDINSKINFHNSQLKLTELESKIKKFTTLAGFTTQDADNLIKVRMANANILQANQKIAFDYSQQIKENIRENVKNKVAYTGLKLQVAITEFEAKLKRVGAKENIYLQVLLTQLQVTAQRIASAMASVSASAALNATASIQNSTHVGMSETWSHTIPEIAE